MLATADPLCKAAEARQMAAWWRAGRIGEIGAVEPPARPARPDRPALRPPREMPRRGKGFSETGRIALLHALAHIELNAIDLACDLIARFAGVSLPAAFYDDWTGVADEESRHFLLLRDRLAALGASYGDLPAHDGLWEAAEKTAHDLLTRLAVVPLVLEARGLDVTPPMIANMHRASDAQSAAVLERIHADEIGHVAIGRRWFEWEAARRGLEPARAWRALVRAHYGAVLKGPFNDDARARAGLSTAWYGPLAKR